MIIPQPDSLHSAICLTSLLGEEGSWRFSLLISLMGRRKPPASHVAATTLTHNYTGRVYVGARCCVRQLRHICCSEGHCLRVDWRRRLLNENTLCRLEQCKVCSSTSKIRLENNLRRSVSILVWKIFLIL